MEALERLTIYREQLAGAQTFEEYRAAHIAWVEMLIEHERADEAKNKAVERWVATVQPEIKVKLEPANADSDGK